MYPIHIYKEGMELPTEGTYFLVAGNGLWLHKDMEIVRGFVPVDNISFLDDLNIKTQIHCNLPKLSAQHVWQIKKFFAQVVERFHSESSVTLYYNKTKKDFKIFVPEQSVSHGGVSYKRTGMSHQEDMKDYLCVGTIHSHCDFGAFHSSIDIQDEENFDGLHCTFGNNDKDVFTVSASVVMNGKRTSVDPLSVLDGLIFVEKIGSDSFYSLENHSEEQKTEWSKIIDQWNKNVSGMRQKFSFQQPLGNMK